AHRLQEPSRPVRIQATGIAVSFAGNAGQIGKETTSMRKIASVFVLLTLASATLCAQQTTSSAADSNITYLEPTRANYLKLADEVEIALHRDVLDAWFPRTVDNENGGFRSSFTRDWQPGPSQGKFSVFQGRMTWISSQVVMRRPELKDKFLPIVKHGVDYLND